MRHYLPDNPTLRQQIDFHLKHNATGLFRASLKGDDAPAIERHAPNFWRAWHSDGDVTAALGVDLERLYAARAANRGKLSPEGESVFQDLSEVRHLFAATDRAFREAEGLAAQSASPGGGSELWRDVDGKPVHVYAPQDRLARAGAAEVGLGAVVKAMVTGRGLTEILNALGTGTVSAGGALVPSELADDVIDVLRARSTVIRAGARTVRLPTQVLTIAKVTGDPTLSWAAEAASISDTGPTFGTVTLTAKTLRAWVKVSRELVEDAPNLGEVLRDVFAKSMAVELDRAALVGSGSGAEPRGIGAAASAAPIVSMGTDGAAITSWDKVLDCLQTVQDANAGEPSAMILAPRTAATIAKLKDSTNQPLAVPPALAGIPRYATTAMPVDQTQGTSTDASSIVLGDFAQLLLGVRSELSIIRSEGALIETNQIALLFVLRADVGWTHAESFVQLRGIVP